MIIPDQLLKQRCFDVLANSPEVVPAQAEPLLVELDLAYDKWLASECEPNERASVEALFSRIRGVCPSLEGFVPLDITAPHEVEAWRSQQLAARSQPVTAPTSTMLTNAVAGTGDASPLDTPIPFRPLQAEEPFVPFVMLPPENTPPEGLSAEDLIKWQALQNARRVHLGGLGQPPAASTANLLARRNASLPRVEAAPFVMLPPENTPPDGLSSEDLVKWLALQNARRMVLGKRTSERYAVSQTVEPTSDARPIDVVTLPALVTRLATLEADPSAADDPVEGSELHLRIEKRVPATEPGPRKRATRAQQAEPAAQWTAPRVPEPSMATAPVAASQQANGVEASGGFSIEQTDAPDLHSLPPHAAAAEFPLVEGVPYRNLLNDIRSRGLRDPIVVARTGNGFVLLDGRNRLRACRELGLPPKYKIYEGDDPVAFIRSANLRRRHLKAGAIVKAARALGPLVRQETAARGAAHQANGGDLEGAAAKGGKIAIAGEERGKTREVIAAELGVSPRTVQSAMTVDTKGTAELRAEVDAGLPTHLAARVATLPPDEQKALLAAASVDNGTAGSRTKKVAAALRAKKPHGKGTARKAKTPTAVVNAAVKVNANAWDATLPLTAHPDGTLVGNGEVGGQPFDFLVTGLTLSVRRTGGRRN